jgi:hypothetical protein
MFFARSHVELHNIRRSIEQIGKISDNVVGFGPVGIGLEGVLEFVPVVGEVYSLGAGFMLVLQGIRVRAPFFTVVWCAFLILLRTLIGSMDVTLEIIPVLGFFVGQIGNVVAGLFRAHRMAANMLVETMDDTLYLEGTRRDPENIAALEEFRASGDRRRIVFLG